MEREVPSGDSVRKWNEGMAGQVGRLAPVDGVWLGWAQQVERRQVATVQQQADDRAATPGAERAFQRATAKDQRRRHGIRP
jgi:hypothetical protein